MRDIRCRKILSRSFIIAVGSSLAIFVAQLLRLQNATSRGMVIQREKVHRECFEDCS